MVLKPQQIDMRNVQIILYSQMAYLLGGKRIKD
jgi:hypothetical protein